MTLTIHTFGCKLNQTESRSLRALFEEKGFHILPPNRSTEVVVINTCTVTHIAEQKAQSMIRDLTRHTLCVLVCGCFAHLESEKIEGMGTNVFVFDGRNGKIDEVLNRAGSKIPKLYYFLHPDEDPRRNLFLVGETGNEPVAPEIVPKPVREFRQKETLFPPEEIARIVIDPESPSSDLSPSRDNPPSREDSPSSDLSHSSDLSPSKDLSHSELVSESPSEQPEMPKQVRHDDGEVSAEDEDTTANDDRHPAEDKDRSPAKNDIGESDALTHEAETTPSRVEAEDGTTTGTEEPRRRAVVKVIVHRKPRVIQRVVSHAVAPAPLPDETDAELAASLQELDEQQYEFPDFTEMIAEPPSILEADSTAEPEPVPVTEVPRPTRPDIPAQTRQPKHLPKPNKDHEVKGNNIEHFSRAFLKIEDGCNNHCTYCRVCLARGPSISIAADLLVERLRDLEAEGYNEAVLTGLNLNQYEDEGRDLGGLVQYLLEGTDHIRLRLSSLEPEALTREMAQVFAHKRVRPHFHVSVQSGSNGILRRMGRHYSVAAVESTIKLLRSIKEDPFLSADIIAGFPGETETEFTETEDFCRTVGFSWMHVFPFSARPGTEAFAYPRRLTGFEIGKRVNRLIKVARVGRRSYVKSQIENGKILEAIVEQRHKALPENRVPAVSENYLKLAVRTNQPASLEPGSLITVKLTGFADQGQDAEADDVNLIPSSLFYF